MDNTQTDLQSTNAQGSELSSGAGAGDVSVKNDSSVQAPTETAVLSKLAETTGLKFNSVEEVAKKISGLNKLVGDQKVVEYRRKAEALDKLTKGEVSKEEVEMTLAPFITSPDKSSGGNSQAQDSSESARISRLERELDKEKFLKKYPHAAEVVDDVLALAGNRSLEDAFLNSKLSKFVTPKESTEDATLVPNKRVAIPVSETAELEQKLREGKGTDQDRRALVRALGLAK